MPKTWHDRHTVNKIEDEDTKTFYRDIVADKKPYFMRYIYPQLMKQYNTYIRNTDRNAIREFRMTVGEMMKKPYGELTDRQREFLKFYGIKMPVGVGNCVMNRICRRFEEEFDGYLGRHNANTTFDYRIMKSNADYSNAQFCAIKKLYEDYNKRLQNYSLFAMYEKVDKADAAQKISLMDEEFRRECDKICSNEDMLCDILLDICYTSNRTKKFAWSMCGKSIIHNLLAKNNNTISFPVLDPEGDIYYSGERYSLVEKRIEVEANGDIA